jgi:hypothetical protein
MMSLLLVSASNIKICALIRIFLIEMVEVWNMLSIFHETLYPSIWIYSGAMNNVSGGSPVHLASIIFKSVAQLSGQKGDNLLGDDSFGDHHSGHLC